MKPGVLLAVIACAGCAGTRTVELSSAASAVHGNLSEALFWASESATGARFCDRDKRKEFGADFDARFGSRVRALTAAHEARYGRDAPFIEITSCRAWQGSDYDLEALHKQAMDRFEYWLRAAEQEAKRL